MNAPLLARSAFVKPLATAAFLLAFFLISAQSAFASAPRAMLAVETAYERERVFIEISVEEPSIGQTSRDAHHMIFATDETIRYFVLKSPDGSLTPYMHLEEHCEGEAPAEPAPKAEKKAAQKSKWRAGEPLPLFF